MDLAIVVYWLSLTFMAAILVGTRGLSGTAFVTGGLLLIAPGLLWWVPEQAPWLVSGLWIGLVLLPNWLNAAAGMQGLRQNYLLAFLLALVAAILHPLDGQPEIARFYWALWLEQRGRADAAEAILRRLALKDTGAGLNASVYLARRDGSYEALLDDPRLMRADAATASLRIWILGESGRLAEMLALFGKEEQRGAPPAVRLLNAMYVLVFSGRPRIVGQLHDLSLGRRPVYRRSLWIATAQLAAGGGEAEAGRATLIRMAQDRSPLVRQLAGSRLRYPPEVAPAPPALQSAQLDAIASTVATPIGSQHPRPRRSYATLLLVAANCAMFVAELLAGDPQDDRVLYDLGALSAPDVFDYGAWWRLGSAMFLHAGVIHLATNMLGLLVLGSFIEPMLGRFRFLLLYLGAGLVSNTAIVLLSHYGVIRTDLLVGASGAIMGLIGAIGASAARQWIATRSSTALSRLLRVGLALVLQTAIDLTTPRISVSAHLCGAATGFVLGLFLRFDWTREVVATGRAAATTDVPVQAAPKLLRYVVAGGAIGASLLIAAAR